MGKGSYRELAHPLNSGAQSQKLISSALKDKTPTLPLYAFYNPHGTCSASSGKVRGVELADGYSVAALVQAAVKAKPKKSHCKRIETLGPLFFPISTILCPVGEKLSPRSALDGVIARSAERREAFDWGKSARDLLIKETLRHESLAYGSSPAPLPPQVIEAIENREHRSIVEAKVRRPKAIVVT